MKSTRTVWLLVVVCAGAMLSGCAGPGVRVKKKLAAIDSVVAEEIEKGSFPGAVIAVGRGREVCYREAFGNEVVKPYTEAACRETIFDLASLTKPVATATSAMILVDRGKLGLEDKVGRYLPAFDTGGKEEVRIKHLLTHTSGLPAYTNADTLRKEFGGHCPEKVLEKICGFEARSKPGEKFTYSCLGYITLAKIVEIVSGEGVDKFAGENIFAPLGMRDTGYRPSADETARVAATEIVDGKPLRGTVHDPLARLMGGVSGNAGLFSTASDLSIYCRMLLNGGTYRGRRILSEESVWLLTTVQSHGRAFGFDVGSSYSWIKGSRTSQRAFCHSGYTGTSIVCDPETGVFVIILTNRAHPHDKGASKPVRTKVADTAFGALGEPKG